MFLVWKKFKANRWISIHFAYKPDPRRKNKKKQQRRKKKKNTLCRVQFYEHSRKIRAPSPSRQPWWQRTHVSLFADFHSEDTQHRLTLPSSLALLSVFSHIAHVGFAECLNFIECFFIGTQFKWLSVECPAEFTRKNPRTRQKVSDRPVRTFRVIWWYASE